MCRIKTVLVTCFVMFFTLQVHGQNLSLNSTGGTSLKLPDTQFVTLSNAFSNIENEFNVHIVYDNSIVEGRYALAPQPNKYKLQEQLAMVIGDKPLVYKIVGARTIVLKEKEPENAPQPASASIQNEVQNEIRGLVVDEHNEPLVGANVFVKGAQVGAATDEDGFFQFTYTPTQNFTIVVSFIGYKTKEQEFSLDEDLVNILIELVEDVFSTETIVVTGIASKTSKAVAEVAVARINAAELSDKQSYSGFSQLVSGKIPGVGLKIASGNVGSGWRFNVRGGGGLTGSGQPVIYIDGVRIDNSEFSLGWTGGQTVSAMSNLNANDIENIEVLKGPAASAMYGTGGSNGVVLITTKGGKMSTTAGVPHIEYKFTTGINEQYYIYDNTKFLNADLYNSIHERDGFIREHQLALSGGNSQFRYRTSFTNRYEQGLVGYQNWMDRSSIRANIIANPYPNLNVKVSTGFTWNKLRQPQWDNNTYSWSSNAFTYEKSFRGADSIAIANFQTLNESKQFIGSTQIIWSPYENVEINAGAGIESVTWDGTEFRPYGYRYGTAAPTGQKDITRRSTDQYTYDLNARYSANLFDIDITSIVGTQILERRYFRTWAGGQFFPNPIIQEIQALAEKEDATEYRSHTKSAGIYWNNEFSYDDTYYWTLAVRKDYSSVIGKDAPAIIYPKASAAVRIDRFGILPPAFGIDFLKLRVAYGETGQLPSLDDGIPITWGTSVAYDGSIGYQVQSKGNDKIEPERIKEWEFGLDMEFLKMFSLEFTHYRQDATDLIVPTRSSPSTGQYGYSYPVNVGLIESYGFETMFQVNPIRTPDYNLNISFIHNYQQNKVIDVGEVEEIIYSGNEVIRPGLPKNEFFMFVPVAPMFDDDEFLPDGDPNPNYQKYIGARMSTERVRLGNPIPNHTGSVSINFKFLKNFNFYASGEWSWKNYMHARGFGRNLNYFTYLPQRRLALMLGYREIGQGNTRETMHDRDIVKLVPGTPEYIAAAWEYIQYHKDVSTLIKDASFFVFRELSLSYDLTDFLKEYFPNPYIKKLSMGVAVRNVWRTSKYELGFENAADGGRSSQLGEDYNTLAQPRSITFFTNFGF